MAQEITRTKEEKRLGILVAVTITVAMVTGVLGFFGDLRWFLVGFFLLAFGWAANRSGSSKEDRSILVLLAYVFFVIALLLTTGLILQMTTMP